MSAQLTAPAGADADLVSRTLAGDREAYADLVRRHQQPLHRFLRGMGLDYDTALDLVQDAFVRGYTRLRECRDPEHVRAWLFSIARNLCFDYLKNVRRQTIPFSSLPGADHIPGAPVDWDGPGRALHEALDALPTLLREAFLLKHDAGYTYEEIAAMDGVSPSAVKMRVHRARELLRAFLYGCGVGPADVTMQGGPVVSVHEHGERLVRARGQGAHGAWE